MITERTLKKWRKEALHGERLDVKMYDNENAHHLARTYVEINRRVIKLTQELLDQHLLRK